MAGAANQPLTRPYATAVFDDDLIGTREAAEMLDHVNARTLRRWTKLKDRPLPSHKVCGGKILFSRREIHAWVIGHRMAPSLRSPRRARKAVAR